MRVNLHLILTMLILACSCNRQSKIGPTISAQKYRDESVIEKFTLPFKSPLLSDSTSLFFYYTHSFDTSWLVHIVKTKTKIRGVYYSVLPTMHRDLDSYPDSAGTLLFDGAGFVVSEAVWDSLVLKARDILTTDSLITETGCLDCSEWCLEYASRRRISNNKNKSRFLDLSEYLRNTLLLHIIQLRREMSLTK